MNVSNQNLARAARSLVDRARDGDQNAMGVLAMVKKNAEKGNARALATRDFVMAYIRENPIGRIQPKAPRPIQTTEIGEDAEESLQRLSVRHEVGVPLSACIPDIMCLAKENQFALLAGCVILANGPPIRNAEIKHAALCFPSVALAELFDFVVKTSLQKRKQPTVKSFPKEVHPVIYAGQCIGMAQALQRLKYGAPIGQLYPMAAWELGEDRVRNPRRAPAFISRGD